MPVGKKHDKNPIMEVVVEQETQILPRYVVYFKKS